MSPVALDRLRDGRDISAVLRGRRQRAGRRLVVHALDRGDRPSEPRLAVVASRRAGNAVERNRAKRLLREAARHLSWREGSDIVLVARAACTRSDLAGVSAELERLAGGLGLLAAEPTPSVSPAPQAGAVA